MPDLTMPPNGGESKTRFERFETMTATRSAACADWYAWLRTGPSKRLATAELMLWQGMLRELHDQATGRRVLDNGGVE